MYLAAQCLLSGFYYIHSLSWPSLHGTSRVILTYKSCAVNLCHTKGNPAVDTSFQRCIHNLLSEPFLCSVNRLDPGAQRQEKLLSGTNSGAVFLSPGNRSFNARSLPRRFLFLPGQLWIVMNSSRMAICAQEWPRTHACDKDINVLPCLFFRSPGLFIGNILWSTIMTFILGHSQISWVTRAVICYYLE